MRYYVRTLGLSSEMVEYEIDREVYFTEEDAYRRAAELDEEGKLFEVCRVESTMTVEEAKDHFGIEDTDELSKAGIEELIENTRKRLAVWSLPNYVRRELGTELEALMVLKEIVEK